MRKRTELHDMQANYEYLVLMTTTGSTARRYSKALEAFFSRFPDKGRAEEFTRRDVEDYKIWRLREGLNPRTINYELTIVRAFWNWMIDQDIVTWNPAAQVKRLREKEAEKKSLSIADQLQLWKGCWSWADKALVGLALTTGLRGATLVSLEKSEINFERGCLTIPAEKMKTGRNHEIPLPKWVVEIMKEAPNGKLFEGYSRNTAGLSYRWNSICRRSGIDSKGIRSARRTFATTLLRSGADLKLVQDLLGHRNVITTSRYLTPADSQTARDAVNKLPNPEEHESISG